MKNYIRFLIGLFLLAGLTGCLKPICSQRDEIHIDSYAKSLFFSFPIGSYWIYKDSLGNTDSTWVSGSGDGPPSPSCLENCTWSLSSNDSNNSFFVIGIAGTPSSVVINVNAINGAVAEGCLDMYFLNGVVDSTYNPANINYASLTDYSVNQFVFPNAIKIKAANPVGCIVSYIVVVPNIGIVEMSGRFGYPLKLIKYSIK